MSDKGWIRACLFVLYLVGSTVGVLLFDFGGYCHYVLAALFAIASVLFTGPSWLFVRATVFLLSCVAPTTYLLLEFGLRNGSWNEVNFFLWETARSLSWDALEMFGPLVAAVFTLLLMQYWKPRGASTGA